MKLKATTHNPVINGLCPVQLFVINRGEEIKMPSEWTRKLSPQQLEGIRKDTKEHEERYPDSTRQPHIYKDIDAELRHREHTRRR
jgi:hypothetical protein